MLGVLQSSRVTREPDEIEPGYSENALAEELARIMKRRPVRAVGAPGEAALRRVGSDEAVEKVIEVTERERGDDPQSKTDPDPASSATAALPAWATGRKRRAGVHRVRMVGASLLAMTVVLAIVGGTAVAMFGNRADVAALGKDVVGKLKWAPWASPTGVEAKAGQPPRGMDAARDRPTMQ